MQNGDTIFVATTDSIQIFKNGKKVAQETMKSPKAPSSIAANPAVSGEFAVGSEDTHVYIYTSSGSSITLKTTLSSSHREVTALAYSSSGEYLAAGDSSGKIILYAMSGGEYSVKTPRWAYHVGRISCLKFNDAGTHCVSGSLDTHVYVWSTLDVGKYIAIKNASKDGVWGVAWVGEKRIVSAGGDGAVKVWDVAI